MILLSNDLQSKWGFFDGHFFNVFINEKITQVAAKIKKEIRNNVDFKKLKALSFQDDLLEIVIRKYMFPKIPHKV